MKLYAIRNKEPDMKRICKRLTNHRWRKLEACSVGIEPTEYHYKCRICREAFWNHKPPTRKRDIERLERWRREG